MKYRKITLVGMMGSGKTTISRLLAQKLNFEFVDLDELFEKENKIKIKDYFKFKGEDSFRKKESELLKITAQKNDIVISTGGGIVIKEENQNILYKNDIFSIYLETSADVIFNRIKDDKTRPLLMVDNPKQEIEKILNKRKNLYSKAHLTINTDNKTEQEVLDEIWKQLI